MYVLADPLTFILNGSKWWCLVGKFSLKCCDGCPFMFICLDLCVFQVKLFNTLCHGFLMASQWPSFEEYLFGSLFSESLKFERSPFQRGFSSKSCVWDSQELIRTSCPPAFPSDGKSDQRLTRPSKLVAPLFPVDDDCLKLSRTAIISTKN